MKLLYDIRAEVWLAQLSTATGPTQKAFVVQPKSTFSRPYNHDILQIDTIEGDDITPETYYVSLSREGLYDMLPEQLAHPPAPPRRPGSDETRALLEESKRLRQEEKEARQFWSPFDQELFRQRVHIEEQERLALSRSFGPIWDELHGYLWGELPVHLSARQRACLLAIWINAYKTVGDWDQTSFYFSEFLQTPIRIEHGTFSTKVDPRTSATDVPVARLGTGRLGHDWVIAAGALTDDGGTVQLHIGPLSDEQLSDFLPGGVGLTYLRMLADYLLPADADWIAELLPDPSSGYFVLDDNDSNAGRLGMTSALA